MSGNTFTISGISGQTSRLQEWTSSGGTVLAYIGHDGRFYNANSVNTNNISADSIAANSLTGDLFSTNIDGQSITLSGGGNNLSIINSSLPIQDQTVFSIYSSFLLENLLTIKSDGDAAFYGNITANGFIGDGSNLTNISVSNIAGLNVDTSNLGDGRALTYDSSSETLVFTDLPTGSGGSGGVSSVNGETGSVLLTASDVGAYTTSEVDSALSNKADTSTVENLNDILALLVPPQPPSFPNGSLSVGGSGSSPRIASNVPDNTNGGIAPSPGSAVTRVTSNSISSNTLEDVGPGKSGVLSVFVNDTLDGSVSLSSSNNNGLYGSLRLSDNKDYPTETPGFWQSLDASIENASALVGVNRYRISHSETSSTNEVYIVRDSLNSSPSLSGGDISEVASGTYSYSSGIPHYGYGGELFVENMYMNNISGETYYGGSDAYRISSTNGIFSTTSYSLENVGISIPVQRGTTSYQSLSSQTISVNGNNVHNKGQVQLRGRNVRGTSSTLTLSTQILVKRGSSGSRIDEMSISVINLGSSPNSDNGVRVNFTSGDNPEGSFSSWDSSVGTAPYEAAVVGGVLSNDREDYSSGYLPTGPDRSSYDSSQYATFVFQRTPVSKFDIEISGRVSGVWVKLPGVSDLFASANGWWDMSQPYAGAGSPGINGNGSDGCSVGGAIPLGQNINGRYTCTFGTESSSASINNTIIVRFKFNSGESLSFLRFREASN